MLRRTLQTQKVALNRHEQRASTKSGPCALQRGPLRQTTKTRKYKGGACALQPCKQEQQNNNNNNKNAHVRALQTGPCQQEQQQNAQVQRWVLCSVHTGAWKQQQKRASTKAGLVLSIDREGHGNQQQQQKRASYKTRKYKGRSAKTRKYKGGSGSWQTHKGMQAATTSGNNKRASAKAGLVVGRHTRASKRQQQNAQVQKSTSTKRS